MCDARKIIRKLVRTYGSILQPVPLEEGADVDAGRQLVGYIARCRVGISKSFAIIE